MFLKIARGKGSISLRVAVSTFPTEIKRFSSGGGGVWEATDVAEQSKLIQFMFGKC